VLLFKFSGLFLQRVFWGVVPKSLGFLISLTLSKARLLCESGVGNGE
jgi:hypothetical protein